MIGDVLSRFLSVLPAADRAWVLTQPGEHQQRMAGQWALAGNRVVRAGVFDGGPARSPGTPRSTSWRCTA